MKFFITGATGFIGSRIVNRLAAEGHDIICLTRNLSRVKLHPMKNITFIEGDIKNPIDYERYLKNVDCLFHLSAYVDHIPFKKKEMYETNVVGTRMIFEAALKYKVPKVIYLSSVAVFHPTLGVVIDESSPFPKKFINDYSYSKYQGFLEAKKFFARGLNIVTLMPASVYGPGSPLFYDLFKFLYTKKIFFKYLLNKKLSLIYVEDVVSAALLAFERGKVGESYIIADNDISVEELLNLFEESMKIKIKILPIPNFIIDFSLLIYDFFEYILGNKNYPNRQIFKFIFGNFLASGNKFIKEFNFYPSNFKINFLEMINDFKLYQI